LHVDKQRRQKIIAVPNLSQLGVLRLSMLKLGSGSSSGILFKDNESDGNNNSSNSNNLDASETQETERSQHTIERASKTTRKQRIHTRRTFSAPARAAADEADAAFKALSS
jgi:hypothetical protein